MLEPTSLSRSDGITVMPWANSPCMVWDFTCTYTLAASNLNRAVLRPGAAASDAESRKPNKYQSLSPLYQFTPIAVETLGALGDEASAFLPRPWTSYQRCHWWASLIPVSYAKNECDYAARQRCLHSRGCSQITGSWQHFLFINLISYFHDICFY